MARFYEPVEEEVSNLRIKRRRSRGRAWRDGLADQTVVNDFEDIRSYRALERALVGSVDPRSVLELALVHRLASLLWRLRRASAIETGLFELQVEALHARRQDPSRGPRQPGTPPMRANGHSKVPGSNGRDDPPTSDLETLSTSLRPPLAWPKSRTIAQCFLRLSNLNPTLLDRASSYEVSLWRQAAQTIWTLEEMRRPPPAPTTRRLRRPAGISYWDAAR